MVDMPEAPEKFRQRLMPAAKLLMPDELHSEEFKKYIYEVIKRNPNLLSRSNSGGVSREEMNNAIIELRKSRKVIEAFKRDYSARQDQTMQSSAAKPSAVSNASEFPSASVNIVVSPAEQQTINVSLQQDYEFSETRENTIEAKPAASASKIAASQIKQQPPVQDISSLPSFYELSEAGQKALQKKNASKIFTKEDLENPIVDKNFSDFKLVPHEKKLGLFSQLVAGLKGQSVRKPRHGSDEEKVALLKEDVPFEIDLFPKIINLPDIDDRTKINIRYPLLPPFAYAHIFWDDKNNELVYFVEEPFLTDKEKELLHLVQVALEEMINIPFSKAQNTAFVSKYLQKNVQAILIELSVKITRRTYQKIMYYIYRDGIGMNDIEPLLKDYYIEDIECNGIEVPVYIVHRKYGNLRTNVVYNDYDSLADFVEKLAQKTGRYVSYAQPLLDGALPDGSRVNATFTRDITTRGPTFTIRKFTKEPWSPSQLITFKTATAELFAYLWLAIEYKFNVMVIGETGAGKTSFLNSILQFIPSEARICSVEDTRELNLMHDNWLPAVQRMGFGMPNMIGQKYGEVTMFDLLKESFRQNPDYMVIGEVRGQEAYVLFQGMASGHPSYGTFHAGDVGTMIRRLETAPINLSPSLVESMDIVVVTHHIKTSEKSIRRVREVCEIIEVTSKVGDAKINKSFEWDAVKDKINFLDHSFVFEKICKRIGLTKDELEKEFGRRVKLLTELEKRKVSDFKDFKKVINNYYKDKKGVLSQFGLKM